MRFLIAFAVIAVTVYSVIDCVRADDRVRRDLPAWLWVTVIIVLPGVGGAVWLVVSHLAGEPRPRPVRRSRPLAPDDDPDFLAGLGRPTGPQPPQRPAPPPGQGDPSGKQPPRGDGGTHPDSDPPGDEHPTREDGHGRRSPE